MVRRVQRLIAEAKGATTNTVHQLDRGTWWAYAEGSSRIFHTEHARAIFLKRHPEYWAA